MEKEDKPASEISAFLQQAKNELHQRQQLFIAQKAYADALESEPPPEDQSPKAIAARKTIEEAKVALENLNKLIDSDPLQSAS